MAKNTQLILKETSDLLAKKLELRANTLPERFNVERFKQNCLSVMNDSPKILDCTPTSIVNTLFKGAVLGLDFFNGECYAIPYFDKGKNRMEMKFQTDYKGETKLCREYSIREIKNIFAKVVREDDDFLEEVVNGEPSITFRPLPFNDGKIIGAFALVVYTDGGMDYETMSTKEIEEVKNFYSNSKSGDVWKKSLVEMYKKTPLRRLCKHIDLNFKNVEREHLFEESSDFDVKKGNKIEKKEEHKSSLPTAETIKYENIKVVDVEKVIEKEEVVETKKAKTNLKNVGKSIDELPQPEELTEEEIAINAVNFPLEESEE